jgi:hypothetical protein
VVGEPQVRRRQNSSDVHAKETCDDNHNDDNADDIENAHCLTPIETRRTSRQPTLGDI